jgi:hypothetical protein
MAARGRVLLEDFGTSAFRRRLDGMLDELSTPGERRLADDARAGAGDWLVSILVERARLLDRVKKQPELIDMRPSDPLIVVGLPGAPIGAAVDALLAAEPDRRRPATAPDPDQTTEWLGLSMVGYSFERLLGVSSPEVGADEWPEIVDLHRLAWAADAVMYDAAQQSPVFAGADHAHALESLVRTHPLATIAVVPSEPDAAIAASVQVEMEAMTDLGLDLDLDGAHRRWSAHVERSTQALAGLELTGDELAGGAVVAMFAGGGRHDRPAQ